MKLLNKNFRKVLVSAATLLMLKAGTGMAADLDIHKYCQDNVKFGREASSPDNLPFFKMLSAPWTAVQYPSESSRRAIFDSILDRKYDDDDRALGQNEFNSLAKSSTPITTQIRLGNFSEFSDEYKKGQRLALLLCGYYSPLNAISCSNALKKNLELTKPNIDIALPSVYTDTLSDKITVQGIFLVAERIKALVSSNHRPGTRLFEDFVSAYSKLNVPLNDARERAWSVMALFSTGGPNTAARISSLFPDASFSKTKIAGAVLLITVGAQVLDARTSEFGYIYSLPREVSSGCDNGKAYHFWLPAYLAHRARQAHVSSTGSSLAAWLVDVGYQITSTAYGRDPSLPFSTPWDDPGNNKIRIDLAYAAAGAIYGSMSNSLHPSKIDLDGALIAMIESGSRTASLNLTDATKLYREEPLRSFKRWNDIFAPITGLNTIRSNLVAQ